MKQGKTLAELADQIKRDSDERRDFITPTTELTYTDKGAIAFKAKDRETNRVKRYEATPTHYCLTQMCDRSGIPAKYAERMADHPALMARNLNYWWQHKPEDRMLRTLLNGEHRARAFLSSIYRPLENADLAAIVLPKLAKLDCQVLSCEITETRLYIQAATPRLENKLVGDIVQAGLVVSNSEVGAGALALEPLLYYLRCKNGMVMPRVLSRYHIGRRKDEELDAASEYYTDKTKEMDDRAFWSKVNDVVEGLFDKERFTSMVDAFEGTAQQRIKGTDAVQEVSNRFQLTEGERDAVLNHLIEGGELNVFGLINAVTRTATDVESYDRSMELQRIGGRIMELPKHTWN